VTAVPVIDVSGLFAGAPHRAAVAAEIGQGVPRPGLLLRDRPRRVDPPLRSPGGGQPPFFALDPATKMQGACHWWAGLARILSPPEAKR
jgi:hypothetical protein